MCASFLDETANFDEWRDCGKPLRQRVTLRDNLHPKLHQHAPIVQRGLAHFGKQLPEKPFSCKV